MTQFCESAINVTVTAKHPTPMIIENYAEVKGLDVDDVWDELILKLKHRQYVDVEDDDLWHEGVLTIRLNLETDDFTEAAKRVSAFELDLIRTIQSYNIKDTNVYHLTIPARMLVLEYGPALQLRSTVGALHFIKNLNTPDDEVKIDWDQDQTLVMDIKQFENLTRRVYDSFYENGKIDDFEKVLLSPKIQRSETS